MARPRNWLEDDLMGALMQLFRRRGYAAVSVRELEAATGVHATSLYNAYGNKEGLFAAALAAYNAKIVRGRIREHLEREDAPLAGIRAYFTSLVPADGARDPGCLLTNTAVECFALGESARAGVADGLESIRRGFEAALEQARRRGEVVPALAPDEVAPQLLALYQGVLVLVRFGRPRAELLQLVDRALQQLVPPRARRKHK